MKVILNVDVKSLGEEGDVKNVANGYARNFLLPRNLAVPYNEATVAIFEGRKAEIEARKEQKRKDSASLKEKLESASIEITMPAATNGKLYAAVTSNVVAEALSKNYLTPTGSFFNGYTVESVNQKYASDKAWHEKVFSYMELLYDKLG